MFKNAVLYTPPPSPPESGLCWTLANSDINSLEKCYKDQKSHIYFVVSHLVTPCDIYGLQQTPADGLPLLISRVRVRVRVYMFREGNV